jgi:hypothetical protein
MTTALGSRWEYSAIERRAPVHDGTKSELLFEKIAQAVDVFDAGVGDVARVSFA